MLHLKLGQGEFVKNAGRWLVVRGLIYNISSMVQTKCCLCSSVGLEVCRYLFGEGCSGRLGFTIDDSRDGPQNPGDGIC